jgi:ribosomal protein L29
MAKKTNLTEKNADELKSLLSEKREHVRTARFGRIGAKVKDSTDSKKSRAEVARILTEMHSRARAGGHTGSEAAA